MSAATRAILAFGLGLAAGTVIALTDSAPLRQIAAVIEPVGTLWVNAIRMTVIPLVVSLLIAGIASAADSKRVGRMGVSAFAVFLLLLIVAAIIPAAIGPSLFEFLTVDPSAAASLRATTGTATTAPAAVPTFTSWVVGLVPANPLRAAVDGALLPLIIFSVAFALALGRVAPARRRPAVELFQAIADTMLMIVRGVLALAPIGVFALALTLAVNLGLSAAGAVAFYLAAHSGLLVIVIAVLYLVAVMAGGVPLGRFARAALPAQIVGFSTRSSFAALPATIQGAERVLGLPPQVTGFALPLAVTTFRINQGVSWVVGALFIAALYDISLSGAAVALFAATAVAMSFSVPGIPSGSLFIMAPFFATVGLPVEGIGILIALDAIPDLFKTVTNVTAHLTAGAVLARWSGGRESSIDEVPGRTAVRAPPDVGAPAADRLGAERSTGRAP